MNSFTKDIINKPNIVVGKFQKKRNKSGQVKVKTEDYYIYQYKLFSTWGIRRQRINDACKLLEAHDLIVVRRQKGFSNYVKLNVEFENEK